MIEPYAHTGLPPAVGPEAVNPEPRDAAQADGNAFDGWFLAENATAQTPISADATSPTNATIDTITANVLSHIGS